MRSSRPIQWTDSPPPSRAGALWSALAWLWLMSPMLWMWPGPRALTDVLVSAVLLLALWLWRPTLRAAAVVLLVVGVVYLGYYLAVQSVPDEYFWFSVLSATWQEAHEYAESYRLADVLRVVLWLIPALAAVVWLWRRGQPLAGRWRWLGWALLALWLAYAAVSAAKGKGVDAALRKVGRVYPTALAESYLRYAKVSNAMFVVPPAPPPAAAPLADVVVMVIGESASAQRWSLLGYTGNPTNAALEPWRSSMVALPVHTNGNNTAQTVPVLLTGQAMDQLPATGVATYLDKARSAGFSVATHSNQRSFGVGQSFFFTAFRQRSDQFTVQQDGQFDGNLSVLLDQQLQTTARAQRPSLITLHLYGSHPRVNKRYPAEFAKWDDPYDNSLAYTSALLADWMAQLNRITDKRVLLVYISDHGLSFANCGGSYVHGATRSAYEVPLLLWGNAPFRQSNAAWWEQWQARSQHALLPDGRLRYTNLLAPLALDDVLGVNATTRLPAAPAADAWTAYRYPPEDGARQCAVWKPYDLPAVLKQAGAVQ